MRGEMSEEERIYSLVRERVSVKKRVIKIRKRREYAV